MSTKEPKINETRKRVLDVAARQFRANGYSGVGLRGIAKEAGLKAGSLYYHFNSKDEIVTEVLNIGIRLVHEAVEEAVAQSRAEGSSAELTLREAVKAHLSAFLEWSDYTSANIRIFGQLPESVRMVNVQARSDYEHLWDSVFERLVTDGYVLDAKSVRTARLFLLGAMNASLEWFDPQQGNIEGLADQYAQLILHGLLSEGAK